MKTSFFSSILAISTSVMLLTGCVKSGLDNDGIPEHKIDGPVFDFSTSVTYPLKFSYNVPAGYIVGFQVYSEYPLITGNDGKITVKPGLSPIDAGFTDKNGTYNKPIMLPSYVKTIYIYTSYAGVNPRLLIAQIENGGLTTPVPESATSSKAVTFSTKAGNIADYNATETNVFQFSGNNIQTLTLGKWLTAKEGGNASTLVTGEQVKIFGRPTYLSHVNKAKFGTDAAGKDAVQIKAEELQMINTALLGDGSGVPVDPEYLKSGDIKVTKEAELNLIFIQNWGGYCNTLAYYCYETANPPKSINEIKYQVIAIPNAMEHKTDLKQSDRYDVVSLYQGEGIQLKYVDDSGKMSDKFPAGTSVGWILYRDGYNGFGIDPVAGPVRCPSNGKGANFANPAFSNSPNTAVLRYGNFVVIGFDDGDANSGYRDYLDVMFNVQATPSDAIIDEIPDVKPEDPKPQTLTNMGILLYEDLWPFQGDFDMNDVVVRYKSTASVNSGNMVETAEVEFTVLHSGATLNNSFAFYDPNISNAEITITGGEGAPTPVIDKTNNIIRLANNLLDYANKLNNVAFTVKYKYNTPVAKEGYTAAPFNPFITVDNANNGTGKEVHLTNYPPTAAADLSWFQKRTHDWSVPAQGLYYITFENYAARPDEEKGQQLPFAVNITYDKEESMLAFKVTKEGKNINLHYAKFKNWVNSNGKEDTDWYLHYTE